MRTLRPKIALALLVSSVLAAMAQGQASPAKPDESDQRITALVTLLREGDVANRKAAVKALGQMKSDRAVKALLALTEDQELAVYRGALKALAEIGDARARDVFIAALSDVDLEVRNTAAVGLSKLSDDRSVEVMLDFTATAWHKVGDGGPAIDVALAKLGDRIVPSLAPMLRQGAKRRDKALELLVQINTPLAIKTLKAAAQDKDWRLRSSVAKALRQHERPSWATIIDLIGDPHPSVCHAAIIALTRGANNISHRKLPDSLSPELRTRAVDALIDALKGNNITVRTDAARALISVNDPRLVAPYCALLGEGDSQARGCAAMGLARVADASAVPALVKAAKDEDKYVRSYVAKALARVGGPGTVDGLIAVAQDPDTMISGSAIDALARINTPRTRAALVDLLRGDELGVQRRVLASQGLGDDPAAAEAVVRLTATTFHGALREDALEALGRMKSPATAALRLKTFAALIHDSRATLRSAAMRGLALIDSDEGWRTVVTAAGGESDPVALEAMRETFAATQRPVGVEGLAIVLARSMHLRREKVRYAYKHKPVALSVISDLAARDEPSAVAALCKALSDEPEMDVRTTIALKLGTRARPANIDALIKALGDPDYVVRRAAIAALGRTGSKRGIEPIAAAMDDPGTYDLAAYVLARFDARRAAAMYVKALDNDLDDDEKALAREVRLAGATDIVEALITALDRGSDEVRHAAARHLARLADRRAVGPLLKASERKTPAVQAAARTALARLKADGVDLTPLPPAPRAKQAPSIDLYLAELALARRMTDRVAASARRKRAIDLVWANVLSRPAVLGKTDPRKLETLAYNSFGTLTAQQRSTLLEALTDHYAKASKALAGLDQEQFVALGAVLRELALGKRHIAQLALDWAQRSSRWVPACPAGRPWEYPFKADTRLGGMLKPMLPRKGFAHLANADSTPCPAVTKAYAWARRGDAAWYQYLKDRSEDKALTRDQRAGWMLARAFAQAVQSSKSGTYRAQMADYRVRPLLAAAASTSQSESLRLTCTEWVVLAVISLTPARRDQLVREVDARPHTYTDPAVRRRFEHVQGFLRASDARRLWASTYQEVRRNRDRCVRYADRARDRAKPDSIPASVRTSPERLAKYVETAKQALARTEADAAKAQARLDTMGAMKGNW
ncbi:MAG: HEAT repeat domain-containing protein [Phycisphaerae bacterium]|nr:HEAT repeat domain-containing protein [Phycisphaerae bacterium]